MGVPLLDPAHLPARSTLWHLLLCLLDWHLAFGGPPHCTVVVLSLYEQVSFLSFGQCLQFLFCFVCGAGGVVQNIFPIALYKAYFQLPISLRNTKLKCPLNSFLFFWYYYKSYSNNNRQVFCFFFFFNLLVKMAALLKLNENGLRSSLPQGSRGLKLTSLR